MNEIIAYVANNGFAVVFCLLMFYQSRNERESHEAQIKTLAENHALEVKELTSSINELKSALTALTTTIKK